MPSHRRAMPAARWFPRLRAHARVALHAAPRRHSNRPVAAPLAVLGVGTAIAVTIGTAQVGVQPAAAVSRVDDGPVPHVRSAALVARQTAAMPDVARALRALAKRHPKSQGQDAADRRASRSRHRAPLHRWVRPGSGVFTSGFGYRWGRLHAGIDLAGPYGSPIVAATDGCIEYAGPESGYGEVMKIRDWDGTETVYGHMSAFVRTSGCVKAGELIAREGAAGDSTGPHLHFEVHVGGTPVDPRPFLAARGVYV